MSCSTGSTIARASSGSRSRISSVEPLMSANSADTKTPRVEITHERHMAEGLDGERKTVTAAGLADEAGAPATRAPPHFRQNLASAGFTVLKEEQRFSTLVPHFMQNKASAGLVV